MSMPSVEDGSGRIRNVLLGLTMGVAVLALAACDDAGEQGAGPPPPPAQDGGAPPASPPPGAP